MKKELQLLIQEIEKDKSKATKIIVSYVVSSRDKAIYALLEKYIDDINFDNNSEIGMNILAFTIHQQFSLEIIKLLSEKYVEIYASHPSKHQVFNDIVYSSNRTGLGWIDYNIMELGVRYNRHAEYFVFFWEPLGVQSNNLALYYLGNCDFKYSKFLELFRPNEDFMNLLTTAISNFQNKDEKHRKTPELAEATLHILNQLPEDLLTQFKTTDQFKKLTNYAKSFNLENILSFFGLFDDRKAPADHHIYQVPHPTDVHQKGQLTTASVTNSVSVQDEHLQPHMLNAAPQTYSCFPFTAPTQTYTIFPYAAPTQTYTIFPYAAPTQAYLPLPEFQTNSYDDFNSEDFLSCANALDDEAGAMEEITPQELAPASSAPSNKGTSFGESVEIEECSSQTQAAASASSKREKEKITMLIHPKYLGFRYPDEVKFIPHKSGDKHSEHAFENEKVTKLKFQKIDNFPIDSEIDINISSNSKRLFVLPPDHNRKISQDDKVYVVFAGRGLNASLPKLVGNTRCLIVLTKEEFVNLEIAKRSQLRENYDCLILTKDRVKANGAEAKSSRLIERRRAAIDFCGFYKLQNVVFMDDNIHEIGFVAPEGFQKNFEGLFDYTVSEMNKKENMLVSIHTFSNLNRVPKGRMLGCKAWALDLNKIRQYLPGDAMQLCFPDREDAWGEDYYLQILLDTFSETSDGFRILSHQVVELVRHHTNTSSCAKTGVRVAELTNDDIIPKNMPLSLKILEKIEKAIATFNELVREDIERHHKKQGARITEDFEKIRAIQYNLKATDKFSRKKHCLFFSQEEIFKPDHIELKNYQKEAIQFYKQAPNRKNLTFDMATGTGKTMIMLTIAFANFALHKNNIIIVYPYIELIKQLLNEIRSNKYSFLLDYFLIRFEQIFGVSSGYVEKLDYAMLKLDNFVINKSMQEKPHILIFCEDSWRNYLKNSQESNLLKTIALIVFDEAHLQKQAIKVTRAVFPEISIHYYSATHNIDFDSEIFRFNRNEAIKQGHIPPIYVDSTLPNEFNIDHLSQVILGQEHPNGGHLSQHKGIIYVDNIENARKLASKLQEILGVDNVFEIHTNCRDYSANINKFRELRAGNVAIAVDMMHEGYNDERLDFVIYAKTSQVTDTLREKLTQAAGRLHRLCADKHDKIAFLITSNQYQGIVNSYLANRSMHLISNVSSTLKRFTPLGLGTDISEMHDMVDAISPAPAFRGLSYFTQQTLPQSGRLAEEMRKRKFGGG